MTETLEHLGAAQRGIQDSAQHVAAVASAFTDTGDWGTQRMGYLTEALGHLNTAWSLVRAATNDTPTNPAVRSMAR